MMKVMAWLIRTVYRICAMFPCKDKISFLSRQSSRPFDFELLEPALKQAFPGFQFAWACVPESGSFGVWLALRQVWHVATSRICFVDGYIPAVCVPPSKRARCIQLWHALGAIKRFGYQALDTADGRSSRMASALSMHRGYDAVVAGLPGAVSVFSEAFDCPLERIVSIGLPRIDYLVASEFASVREDRAHRLAERFGLDGLQGENSLVVLYAPTLRRGAQSYTDWFARAVDALSTALPLDGGVSLVVSGHPLQSASKPTCEGPVFLQGSSAIDALSISDYVVTDYSAIAFEAAVLGKKVLFYVPDIGEYRVSPGLNIDPVERFPGLSFEDADALAAAIARDRRENNVPSFDECLDEGFLGALDGGCIGRIVAWTERSISGVLDTDDALMAMD